MAATATAAPCPERPEFRPSLEPKAAPCIPTPVSKSPTSETTFAVHISQLVHIVDILTAFEELIGESDGFSTETGSRYRAKEIAGDSFDFIIRGEKNSRRSDEAEENMKLIFFTLLQNMSLTVSFYRFMTL